MLIGSCDLRCDGRRSGVTGFRCRRWGDTGSRVAGMGKASRRATRRTRTDDPKPASAPFASRPFEGLVGETEWVALREIVPAATGEVAFAAGVAPDGAPSRATVATVLPMAWPAVHRNDGEVLVATQAVSASGDPSRDIAAAWLQAAQAPVGSPVTVVPTATAVTPRLQELIDPAAAFELSIHDSFDFWVGETELDEDGQASLEHANAEIMPTTRVAGAPSVFWVDVGDRAFVRWILPQDEDAATDGLARVVAAGRQKLTDDSRLLGVFRACGLIVPVWEVAHGEPAESCADAVAELAPILDDAIASTSALDSEQRRARNGLLSRQVNLR